MADVYTRAFLEERLKVLENEIKEIKQFLKVTSEPEPKKQDSPAEIEAILQSQENFSKIIAPSIKKTDKPPIAVTKSRENPAADYVIESEYIVVDFVANLRNIRMKLGLRAEKVCSVEGSPIKYKTLYAMEVGTTPGCKEKIIWLAEQYGVKLANLDIAFIDKPVRSKTRPKGKVEKPVSTPTVETPKPEKQKRETSNLTKLRRKVTRQNNTDLTTVSTSGEKIAGTGFKKPVNEDAKKAQELKYPVPTALKWTANDKTFSLKGFITRNYQRMITVVKGVCTQKHWDFEETLGLVNVELEDMIKSNIDNEIGFYGDNERFMSWLYNIVKNIRDNSATTQRLKEVEDLVTKNRARSIEEFEGDDNPWDEPELKEFIKKMLQYQPSNWKTVWDKHVVEGKPKEEIQRIIGIPLSNVINILKTMKTNIAANFGLKYNTLIKI